MGDKSGSSTQNHMMIASAGCPPLSPNLNVDRWPAYTGSDGGSGRLMMMIVVVAYPGHNIEIGGKGGRLCTRRSIPAFISQVWIQHKLKEVTFDSKTGRA